MVSQPNLASPEATQPGFNGGNKPCRYISPYSFFETPTNDGHDECSWLPCVMYARTFWRLEQLSKGRDPMDMPSSFTYGYNVICAAWLVAQTVTGIASALATGLQRNRIRAAYGIRGRYSTDICLSLCCTSCVMAQNDREIQAREGSVRYIGRVKDIKGQRHRTTGVKEIQAIHASAPPRIEPMRYVSPRETTEHTSRDSSAPPSHIQGHQTVHEGRSVEPRMPRLAFMKSRKYSVKHTNSQHGTKPESLAGVAEQVLTPNESFNSEGRRISRPDNEMEQCSQQHGPSECFRAGTEDQHTDYRAESPVLANKRAELGTSISDTPYGLTAAHSATESDADNAAASLRGKRSNVGVTGGQELSYTHDFSDCPVNKSVLMYYEKEENRSVKSAVNDSAGRCLSSNNPYKNALGDCVVNSHCSEKDAIIGERTQLLDTAGRSRRPSRHCQVDSSRVSITRSAEDFVARPISYCIDPRAEKKATSY